MSREQQITQINTMKVEATRQVMDLHEQLGQYMQTTSVHPDRATLVRGLEASNFERPELRMLVAALAGGLSVAQLGDYGGGKTLAAKALLGEDASIRVPGILTGPDMEGFPSLMDPEHTVDGTFYRGYAGQVLPGVLLDEFGQAGADAQSRIAPFLEGRDNTAAKVIINGRELALRGRGIALTSNYTTEEGGRNKPMIASVADRLAGRIISEIEFDPNTMIMRASSELPAEGLIGAPNERQDIIRVVEILTNPRNLTPIYNAVAVETVKLFNEYMQRMHNDDGVSGVDQFRPGDRAKGRWADMAAAHSLAFPPRSVVDPNALDTNLDQIDPSISAYSAAAVASLVIPHRVDLGINVLPQVEKLADSRDGMRELIIARLAAHAAYAALSAVTDFNGDRNAFLAHNTFTSAGVEKDTEVDEVIYRALRGGKKTAKKRRIFGN